MFAEDPETAALLRKATEYADAKDWDCAISCLRKANARAPFQVLGKSALRLPLYLQKAGRFDEAMREFERLLSGVESGINSQFAHRSTSVRTMLAHAEYQAIYDKIRLAFQRQGLAAQAAEYGKLAENHKRHHARLMKLENKARAKS